MADIESLGGFCYGHEPPSAACSNKPLISDLLQTITTDATVLQSQQCSAASTALLPAYIFWTRQLKPSSPVATSGMLLPACRLFNPTAAILPEQPYPLHHVRTRLPLLKHGEQCREAALHFLHTAVAPSGYNIVPHAPDSAPPSAPLSLPPQSPPGALHSLLAHLSQPASISARPQQRRPESAPNASRLPLRHRLLQQVQSQHFALQWLIKICTDLALGSSVPLPASSQALSTQVGEVEPWVLLGQLLNILDDYAHRLEFSVEDVVPGHKHRRAPKMVQNILLHLTAIAEAAGKGQRWVLLLLHGCMRVEQHQIIAYLMTATLSAAVLS